MKKLVWNKKTREKFDVFAALTEKLIREGPLDEDDNPGEVLSRPQFTKEHWVHASLLLKAFVNGVLDTERWGEAEEIRHGFEKVINLIRNKVREFAGTGDVVKISVAEYARLLLEWTSTHEVVSWAGDSWREGMDLQAVILNAAWALRSEVTQLNRSKRRTKKEYSLNSILA